MKDRLAEVFWFSMCHLADGINRKYRRLEKFPAYYLSEDGFLVSAKRRKLRFQKAMENQGYLRVNLGNSDPIHPRLLHRLIMETFAGPCPDGMQVRHLNGVRNDNRLVNLAWGTIQENADDRTKHGTQPIGTRNPRAKLTENQVGEIRASKEPYGILSSRYGVTEGMIWFIRKGKNWRHVT